MLCVHVYVFVHLSVLPRRLLGNHPFSLQGPSGTRRVYLLITVFPSGLDSDTRVWINLAPTQLFTFEPIRPVGHWPNRLFVNQVRDGCSIWKTEIREPIRPVSFFSAFEPIRPVPRAYSAGPPSLFGWSPEPIRLVLRAYLAGPLSIFGQSRKTGAIC